MDRTSAQLLGRLLSPSSGPICPSSSCPTHTDPQGGHTAKYPTLAYSDETGFAELTPWQQDRTMKAPWPLRRRWSRRSGPILGAGAASAATAATGPQHT